MSFAKITVKSNYEKRGDLVLRSYVRALKKVNADLLLDHDNAYIYGIVDKKGVFHEFFTKKVIDFDEYQEVTIDECLSLTYMSLEQTKKVKTIVESTIFDIKDNLDFEISNSEELAKDRSVEFDAYNNFMSRINPYQKLSEQDKNSYNDYNSFSRKIEEIKVMRKLDRKIPSYDEYEVRENPIRLIKKK